MHSTPSLVRHSNSILAPLINIDISFPILSKKRSHNKKGHQPAAFAPLMASDSNPWPSSGAGYDDQNNNGDDDYGRGKGMWGHKTSAPGCGTLKHAAL